MRYHQRYYSIAKSNLSIHISQVPQLTQPTQVISSILTTAYNTAKETYLPPALLILTGDDRNALRKYTYDSISKPPVDSSSFRSPFLGWELEKIAGFLNENAHGTVVDYAVFLVADEQTANDEDTLLLVHNLCGGGLLRSVCVSAAYANLEAVFVSVAATDIGELGGLVDGDGVFRGYRHEPPPITGGPFGVKRIE